MNENLKKFLDKIKATWKKWSLVQKGILAGVILAFIVLIIVLFNVSSKPSRVAVLDAPITDVNLRSRIQNRINEEGYSSSFSSDGILYVDDNETALRMRNILISENLIPDNTDPWDLIDVERWTTTDFERNINLRRSISKELEKLIKSSKEIDDATVVVNLEEKTLFKSDRKPAQVSVMISPKPGSDFLTNKKKIEGIQNLILKAIPNLSVENLVITDEYANTLNDFAGMEDFDRLSLTQQQEKIIRGEQAFYQATIKAALERDFANDRVGEVLVKIDMDMSEISESTLEYLPFVRRSDNPETVYDDSEIFDSVTISSETASTTWQGTGLNPEGPAGTEGQTPPAYKDTTNLAGLSTQTIVKQNNAIGEKRTNKDVRPKIERRTVSVSIDGQYKKLKDENGNYIIKNGEIEREYIPLTAEQIRDVENRVKDAIGYDANRNDSVTVVNIQFDRTSEHEAEDRAYLATIQRRKIILISLSTIAVILFILILYRIISRELERRRRLREEEALRKAQLERQQAMWEADSGKIVSITAEERHRMELQENAINLSREHPEDVAMLIRTWLMEE